MLFHLGIYSAVPLPVTAPLPDAVVSITLPELSTANKLATVPVTLPLP